jgi:Ca2+-transporting ATPase
MEKAETEWHMKTVEDTVTGLKTSDLGLSSKEAESRLNRYGPNELEESGRMGPLRMFLQQFANPMVVILLFAVAVSIGTFLVHGSHEEEGLIDAIVISAIVLLNAVFGFVQEYRSEKALEALKDLSAPMAIVKRNGELTEIEARELVPGDVIYIETGDIIPADARLMSAVNLSTDESSLTGESTAVNKGTEPILQERIAIGDKTNSVFQGSIVTSGKGIAVVSNTGMQTEFGKIAQLVQESEQQLTPLQLDLDNLGKRLGVIVLILSFIVFIALVFVNANYDFNEALFVSIAVAVAAIPEGLPAIVTVTLAIGVSRMVKKNAVVRRLPSVETLGSTTAICTDKTGTITKNEMTVRYIYLSSDHITISGTGFEKEGRFHEAPRPESCVALTKMMDEYNPTSSYELQMLLKTGQLCSTAILTQNPEEDESWKVLGDPTEGALLVAAEKAGMSYETTRDTYSEVREISFDSQRKRMTSIYRDADGNYWAFSKGAPEVILERSSNVLVHDQEVVLSDDVRSEVADSNAVMAGCAMRVLALSYRKLPGYTDEWSDDQVESDLVFIGMAGMIDPPREGVIEAIKKSKSAGIRPIMITGDHALTAKSIAQSVGLTTGDTKVVTGTELSEMTEEELDDIVRDTDVFARVAPEHKLRIVRALKRQNQVVAMTGDGVNDAPAIKTADVGIAMGIRGAGVTKEASDLVLTDDNFSTIVSAIEVGREIYANIRKFVRYLLSANTGEVLLIFFMVMIGLPVPLTAVEILFINLVTDGPPALALGFDPPPKDIMDRCPRKPGARMLDRDMTRIILFGGIMATFAAGFVYLFTLWISFGFIPVITGVAVDWLTPENAAVLKLARTTAFVTVVLHQLLWLWNCRDEMNPVWRTNLRESKVLLGAVLVSLILTLLALYTPFSIAFGTVPLSFDLWIVILLPCLIAFLTPIHWFLGNESEGVC